MELFIILKCVVLLACDVFMSLLTLTGECLYYGSKRIYFDFVNCYNRMNHELGTPQYMIHKKLMKEQSDE